MGFEDRENVGGNWVCVGIVGFRAFSLGGLGFRGSTGVGVSHVDQ